MVDLFSSWVDKYPIISIEDPLDQDDWAGYAAMTRALGDKVQVVGDDFFVTNSARLADGIAQGACNSILVKVNQIGTLTETLDAVYLAQRSKYTAVLSPPLGRDRGRDHRRHRRGDQLRPDQDRLGQPDGPGREVQPTPPHRGGTRPRGGVRDGDLEEGLRGPFEVGSMSNLGRHRRQSHRCRPTSSRRGVTMSIAHDKSSEVLGEPAWDVARLFPAQGQWSVEEYLQMANRTNRLVEFSEGRIEVLAMPTMTHQEIVEFLFERLKAFVVAGRLGKVMFAGIRVMLWEDKYREPDVLFMLARHADRMSEQFWDGADLVMEVVSEDRRRDLELKRSEYARAGIPEYWIVDPRDRLITVLVLDGDTYAVHGEFKAGEHATSRLMDGFSVAVDEAFAPKH